MGTEVVEKLPYFLLEKDDDGYHAHADQFVHNAAQKPHFEYLRHKEPHHDKHHDTYEDVERARLLHQAIDIV